MQRPAFAARVEALYQRANQATGGWLAVLRQTLDNFAAARGSQAAAGIAYYTLFSLFPLLLLLMTAASRFVGAEQAQAILLTVLDQVLPQLSNVQDLVLDTIIDVFRARSEVRLIGVLALLWSASAALTSLNFNIDLAWAQERRPSPLKARLIGLFIIIVLYVLLLLSLLATALFGALAARPTPLLDLLGLDLSLLRSWIPQGVSVGLTFLALLGLYRWAPSVRVPRKAAFWAALLAVLALQIVNAGFTWYMGSGLANYELVYGPLTTIIVLLFWFYFTMLIILLGAHASASLARRPCRTNT